MTTTLEKLTTIPSDTLSADLFMDFAAGLLTESQFDAVITELMRRKEHPEVILGCVGLGEPTWQIKYR